MLPRDENENVAERADGGGIPAALAFMLLAGVLFVFSVTEEKELVDVAVLDR